MRSGGTDRLGRWQCWDEICKAPFKPAEYSLRFSQRLDFLWHGQLTDKGGALQLMLIIDRILDWAHDVFRAEIIRRLSTLIEPDGGHVMTDE